MRTCKSAFIWTLVFFIFCVVLAGCDYYRVTDPSTSRIYYTKEVKKLSGGAVQLRDEKTGRQVTLQNSEVEKIKKEAFNQGVYAK